MSDHDDVSQLPSKTQPLSVLLSVIVACGILTSVLLFFFCRCVVQRRRKAKQLTELTPSVVKPRPISVIRTDKPIQFVVPTISTYSETAEESFSDNESSNNRWSTYDGEGNLRWKSVTDKFHIDPTELEHELYVGDRRTSCGSGQVNFSVHYNILRQHLCVRLIGVTDLISRFSKYAANPFAKITLLPEKYPKFVTKVHKKTSNPIFDETFVFKIKPENLGDKTLKIAIWDYDRFSRKFLIGQVLYLLSRCGIDSAITEDVTPSDIWCELQPKEDVNFCVRERNNYSESFFTVVYVKISLYLKKKLVRTKKTTPKKKIPEVEFSDSFNIQLPQSALSDVDLVVSLCDKAAFGGKHLIGRTQVGANCLTEQGMQHWQDMLSSPKSTSAQWHTLLRY
ncbi:synaptotagmin-2-like [Limulus polyphemus]|uniref:Synaptotagmin-2-like n=1 Tax=Limulus polyphemus TaxID=6850 RepID=A0ABM1BDR7_LIMPO|nr:synaptotagmin-2-like [Limulus polyphemus]